MKDFRIIVQRMNNSNVKYTYTHTRLKYFYIYIDVQQSSSRNNYVKQKSIEEIMNKKNLKGNAMTGGYYAFDHPIDYNIKMHNL